MRGFDNRWKDFPDYILGITEEIWEGRGLGARMKEYYAPDVIVRMPGGVSLGEPASTTATMATLVEFPDRSLLGEDVIWSGSPEEGMLSSHRILSAATHLGSGSFGEATGRPVKFRAIADCFAKDGRILDEWLIRDNSAVLVQIGADPAVWARARAEEGATPLTEDADVAGPYRGEGNDDPWGARFADLLERLMAAEFSAITGHYDRACHLEYPGAETGHGRRAADAFWLGLRAALPSARFAIRHRIGREDSMMPPRAAVRWTLTGKHDGWGRYGRPTGAEVHVMGISHAEFGPGGLRREWTLFDDTAIWTQIFSQTG